MVRLTAIASACDNGLYTGNLRRRKSPPGVGLSATLPSGAANDQVGDTSSIKDHSSMNRFLMIRGKHPSNTVIIMASLLALSGRTSFAAPELEQSPNRLAVLDFQNRTSSTITSDEVLYLSDLVRGAARRSLPAERFVLMTRDNIQELLPDGRTLADCVGECAVETGRKIGADLVVTGEVTTFGGQLRVTVNLHEMKNGNLLGQVVAGATDVLGVESDLKAKVMELLVPLRGGGAPGGGTDLTESKIGGGATAWTAGSAAKTVVSFASDPPGAMVEIDGQPVGETPCGRALTNGVYRVGIKKVRYMAHEQSLEVKANAAPLVSVTLTPDFGWITVESEPAGLPVTIDEKSVGQTPVTSREIDTGPHDVLVGAENYHAEGRRIVIERGERETLRVAPVPRNGGLTVIVTDQKANAVEAVVKIDGREVGKAYQTITVLAGKHQVSVDGPAGSWVGEVVVEEAKLVELAARLVSRVQPVAVLPLLGAPVAMVEIPAGSFMMGSPMWEENRDSDEPQHRVEITQGFQLSSTEVTQVQYEKVIGANPSRFVGADRPVEQVSWLDAVQFCNKLSAREGLSPAYRIIGGSVTWDTKSNGYRLPTEAEWEYACRAGTTTAYHTGGSGADLARAGWYEGNAGNETHLVGKKTPNAWGLYDMHGNVWEWCFDWYGEYWSGSQSDPQGAASSSLRVLRGGSWSPGAKYWRSADRAGAGPARAYGYLGFRVARNSAR
jgi:formylglycine-generating enzyme required for sulfatase activity